MRLTLPTARLACATLLLVGWHLAASRAALAQGAPPANLKIGVIDIQEVLRSSISGKAALQRLQDQADKKQEFLKQKQKELEDLQKQYNSSPLSQPKRDELETRIQNLIKEVNRFKEDARIELQKAEEAELKKLEEEVLPLIDDIGKKEGYHMVFGKFQSGLVYLDPSLDITALIIQRYDAAKKAGTLPKPAAPPATPGAGAKSGK